MRGLKNMPRGQVRSVHRPSLQTKYVHLVPTIGRGRSLRVQRSPATGPVGPAIAVIEDKVIARTTERRKDLVPTIANALKWVW